MNIIFIDSTDNYPIEFSARNTKVGLLCKGFLLQGANVSVVNSRSGKEVYHLKVFRHEGIKCFLFSKNFYKNFFRQIILLKKLRCSISENIVIITSTFFPLFVIDAITCKILGYKVFMLFHELRATIRSNKNILKKIDGLLLDRFSGYFVDGIFPISKYLEEKALKYRKITYKLPILADFSTQEPQKTVNLDYFLYCGNAKYYEPIKIILQSYKSFRLNNSNVKLKLVLYGDKSDIVNYIKVNSIEGVEIHQSLNYSLLNEFYRNALCLLIPLDPNSLQDVARFSQKIAEYLSSKRPILTTKVGEVPFYFEDGENAYIAKEYSVESFCESLKYIAGNPEKSNEIGLRGYQTGVEKFNFINHSYNVVKLMKSK